ncbi:MAG: sigma-70 family RNA polymerase sigma factor [Verrucomicrobiales bacterium]|nr:sigma-70 family RNA polymerase sigma factor [Verrucomicrobiales bacterium]
MQPAESDRTTEFLQLLNAHDRALTLYVYGLVPRDSEAEDLLQQTKMLLWRHFDEFELGTNFLAWARKTAFHQVLSHRRKQKRAHVALSDEALEALGEAVAQLAAEPSERHEALRDCLARLPEEHRRLIRWRYFDDTDIRAMAEDMGKTETAVYRALSRIRMTLQECLERHLNDEWKGAPRHV